MSTLTKAAIRHLELCRLDPNRAQAAMFVRLAFVYGVEVDIIAEKSGITVQNVRSILMAGE